ncbi:MAG: DUF4926 domain-containing protein [Opitutaceae bacterium]|nr:DUF4926 domain-containing protein [Opitutaceae bacterium]
MNLKEHESVVLTRGRPESGLEAGDVGTIVHVHRDGAVFEVGFMTLTGRTIAVITVRTSDVRPVDQRDVSYVRQLSAA